MKRQSILSITAAAALALAQLPGRAVSQTGIVLITARSPACQSPSAFALCCAGLEFGTAAVAYTARE